MDENSIIIFYSQSLDFVSSSTESKREYRELKRLRNEFHSHFRAWVSSRKRTRKLLKELQQELSSLEESEQDLFEWSEVFLTEPEGTPISEQTEAPGDSSRSSRPFRPSRLAILGGVGTALLAAPAVAAAGVVAGAAAAGVAAVVGVGAAAQAARKLSERAVSDADSAEDDTTLVIEKNQKIADVRQAIDEDKNACQALQRSQNLLGDCVADFAVFAAVILIQYC